MIIEITKGDLSLTYKSGITGEDIFEGSPYRSNSSAVLLKDVIHAIINQLLMEDEHMVSEQDSIIEMREGGEYVKLSLDPVPRNS